MAGEAGQAAPGTQVDLDMPNFQGGLEAAVALEGQERLDKNGHMKVVSAARASNQPYLVPPVIMAVAVAGPVKWGVVVLETEDWVEVGKDRWMVVFRPQPTQGVEVVGVAIIQMLGRMAAPASSSSATRRKPLPRRRARRVSTSRTGRAWHVRRGRPARAGTRQSAPRRRQVGRTRPTDHAPQAATSPPSATTSSTISPPSARSPSRIPL